MRTRTAQRHPAFAVMILLGVLLAADRAFAVSLADLVNTHGTLTVGDAIFSNFQVDSFQVSGPAMPSSTSQIDVTGFPFHPPATLTISSNFFAASFGPLSSSFSLTMTYDVSLTAPGQVFAGASLGWHVFSDILDHPVGAQVHTVFSDLNRNQVLALSLSRNPDELHPPDSADGTLLTPQTSLQVVTVIELGGALGFSNIGQLSEVNETFVQRTIPEPATWLLLVSGLVALLVGKRRLSRAR